MTKDFPAERQAGFHLNEDQNISSSRGNADVYLVLDRHAQFDFIVLVTSNNSPRIDMSPTPTHYPDFKSTSI